MAVLQRQELARNARGHIHPKASKRYEWLESIDEVRDFLDDNYAAKTRKNYRHALGDFFESTEMDIKQIIALDDIEIKKLIKRYAAAKSQTAPGSAVIGFYCMHSFFEYHGKKLTWQRRERLRHIQQKAKHTPSNDEVWRIAEGSGAASKPKSPLNKAVVLFDFVTGLRSNAVRSARRGLLSGYSENDCPIPIQVWSDDHMSQLGREGVWITDDKLKQYNFDYIYTFLARDGFVAWKEYDDWRKRTFGSLDDKDSLFATPISNLALSHPRLWRIFKIGVKATNIDPKTCSIHSLRRSFKSACMKAGVEFEAREAMMGHTIPGSSASKYWDNHDADMVVNEYMKVDWSSRGTHQQSQILKDVERLKEENKVLKEMLGSSDRMGIDERLARLERMFTVRRSVKESE